MNINQRLWWSLGRDNPVVPSRWLATKRQPPVPLSPLWSAVPLDLGLHRDHYVLDGCVVPGTLGQCPRLRERRSSQTGTDSSASDHPTLQRNRARKPRPHMMPPKSPAGPALDDRDVVVQTSAMPRAVRPTKRPGPTVDWCPEGGRGEGRGAARAKGAVTWRIQAYASARGLVQSSTT